MGFKVLLADNDIVTSEALVNDLTGYDCSITRTATGCECIAELSKDKFDVVILDVVLHEGDGYSVLEHISTMQTPPKVIIYSNISGEIFEKQAFLLGAQIYIVKPATTAFIIGKIEELMQGGYAKNSDKYPQLDEWLSSIFLAVGIPAHIKGYQFLREGIKQVVSDPSAINCITKKLYPAIAVKYTTTSSKVERAIRHAIEVSWSRGKLENLNNLFGFKVFGIHDKPTNGEFIALLADKLLLELKK